MIAAAEYGFKRWGVTTAVLFGIVCITAQYLARISFWHDEAYQVQNVIEQSYQEVATTLARNQTAPPAFMFAVKACGDLLGYNEYALRLLPALMGILAMIAFVPLTRRLLSPGGATLAAITLALSPKLIEHATELKQYSGDVLASILMLWLATRLWNWRASDEAIPTADEADPLGTLGRKLLALSLAAAALAWYSEVQVFIFAGISLAVLPRFHRYRLRGWGVYSLCHLPISASFLVLYWFSMRAQLNGALTSYWIDHGGLPDYAQWWRVPLWMLNGIRQLCNYAVNPIGPIILVLVAIGVVVLWQRARRRELLAALLIPVVLTILAALVHRYPFNGSRATMFLVPSMLLLAGLGLERLLRSRRQLQHAALGLAVVVVISGGAQGTYHLVFPRNQSHPRPAIEYVRAHRTPEQAVWVGDGACWEEFKCYWRNPDALITGPKTPPDASKVKEFWLLLEFDPNQGMRKRADLVERAKAMGTICDQQIFNGGAAYLVRMNDQVALSSSSVQKPTAVGSE